MNLYFFFIGSLFINTMLFGADLTGTIKLTSSAPKKKVIKMNSDPICAKQNAGKTVYFEDITVSDKGNLANVFVYVKEGAKPGFATSKLPSSVLLDQRGCKYIPHVWGVRINQSFTVLNSDPTMHNVHSLAKNNPNFNNGMASIGQKIEKKFSKPEVMIKIRCDVHPWMNTYVGVLDHPYFEVTDLTGRFNIKNLPPGEYTLAAWQEKLGEKIQKVTVGSTEMTKEVNFAF